MLLFLFFANLNYFLYLKYYPNLFLAMYLFAVFYFRVLILFYFAKHISFFFTHFFLVTFFITIPILLTRCYFINLQVLTFIRYASSIIAFPTKSIPTANIAIINAFPPTSRILGRLINLALYCIMIITNPINITKIKEESLKVLHNFNILSTLHHYQYLCYYPHVTIHILRVAF